MPTFVELSQAQYGIWYTVNEILDKQGSVTVKDIADYHKFSPRNARKYLRIFENEGLLVSKKLERKRVWTRSKKRIIVKEYKYMKVRIKVSVYESIVRKAMSAGLTGSAVFEWLLHKDK